MLARLCSVTNLSSGRVWITTIFRVLFSIYLLTRLATFRLMSFSCECRPAAPWSFPPCPASTTTMYLSVSEMRDERQLVRRVIAQRINKVWPARLVVCRFIVVARFGVGLLRGH